MINYLIIIGAWFFIGLLGYSAMCCATKAFRSKYWILIGPVALFVGLEFCMLTRFISNNAFTTDWN